MSTMMKRVETAIVSKLTAALNPVHFEVFEKSSKAVCVYFVLMTSFGFQVINESYKHSVPAGSESHFKVVVVSDKFEGMPLIQRHRLVNAVLEDELKNDVHALSIQAKTPLQWEQNSTVTATPNCLGGSKKAAEK